ncbi:MAG: hypothetical protein CBC38_06260 [Gammaproteobacteria bacterium TMED78]|nr:MAG: hypothetical protein CBC38_06260 [Gammaproteobacteria bacterium TMED78]
MLLKNTIFTSLLLILMSITSVNAQSLLNANTASESELSGIPNINNEVVQLIINSRPFATFGDLNNQLSNLMSDNELEGIYANLFVPLKLNSASDDDIQLIPGVGSRMAHEFEEYRPYTSMDQFRREIGKYVDEDEVARYEMYVILE